MEAHGRCTGITASSPTGTLEETPSGRGGSAKENYVAVHPRDLLWGVEGPHVTKAGNKGSSSNIDLGFHPEEGPVRPCDENLHLQVSSSLISRMLLTLSDEHLVE